MFYQLEKSSSFIRQGSDSPCVDTGSDTSANLGMDIFTTRTDKVWDEGIVDMGYHYCLYVNFVDFAIFAQAWRSQFGDANWNQSCDISDPNDNVIDELDLSVFRTYWVEYGLNLQE